jgi:hypothetical protein
MGRWKKESICYIWFLCIFLSAAPVGAVGQDTLENYNSIIERDIILTSLEDLTQQVFTMMPQEPAIIAGELKKRIIDNPEIKYQLLPDREQKKWEDILISLEVYIDYDLMFRDFDEYRRSRSLKLAILKQESLEFPKGEIIAAYLRENIVSFEKRLKAADKMIFKKGGFEGLDVHRILSRFQKRAKQDKLFINKQLQAVYHTDYSAADHKIFSGKIRNLLVKNQPFFAYMDSNNREEYLKQLFYYCIYSAFDDIVPGMERGEKEVIQFNLLRRNYLDSASQKRAVYNYFIRYSPFCGLEENFVFHNIRDYFTDDYLYTKLIDRYGGESPGLKLYFNYTGSLAFSTGGVLQENQINNVALGLNYSKAGLIPAYPGFTLLLSGYILYNSYNYESLFQNDLYLFARANFNTTSINGGVGFSLLEIVYPGGLKIRPLCFQVLGGYIFYNRIDTKDYGNILLEDALQLLIRGKYFLDVEIKKRVDFLLEFYYSRYSKAITLDANIPLFELGLGLAILFSI